MKNLSNTIIIAKITQNDLDKNQINKVFSKGTSMNFDGIFTSNKVKFLRKRKFLEKNE